MMCAHASAPVATTMGVPNAVHRPSNASQSARVIRAIDPSPAGRRADPTRPLAPTISAAAGPLADAHGTSAQARIAASLVPPSVVELAVFLEMGGELHRIAFVPLGLEHGVAPPAVESAPGEDEVLAFDGSAEDASGKVGALPAHRHSAHGYADLQQRVSTFDVRAAQCAVSFERERLLAMVEQGFGGAHEFNLSLRAVLEPLSVDMPAIRPAAGAARGEGSPMRSTVAFLDAHSTVERAIAAAERAVAIATVFIGQANPPGLSRLPSPQSSRQGAVSPQSSRQGAVRGLTSAEEEVDTADAAAVPAVLAA